MGRTCGQFIHHKISSGGIQFFRLLTCSGTISCAPLNRCNPATSSTTAVATDTSATSWLVRRVEVTISASVRRPSIQ